MLIRYCVDCFDRELVIEFPDGYKHLESEILSMLESYYDEWNDAEYIEDPEYRSYVEDSCLEEFMMERLSETYNIWNAWWCEGDGYDESDKTYNKKEN